jgi:hypothetical protein
VLIPSLAMLFGLVLRGRFDEAANFADTLPGRYPSRGRPVSPLGLAVALGAVGVPLTLIFDGGPLLAAGIVALLAFVALGAVALLSAVAAYPPDEGGGPDS